MKRSFMVLMSLVKKPTAHSLRNWNCCSQRESGRGVPRASGLSVALCGSLAAVARGRFPYSLDLIVKQPTLRNPIEGAGALCLFLLPDPPSPFVAEACKERRRGSRAPTGAGGERRT